MSSSEDEKTLVHRTVDTALSPFRAATSETAQRAYLGTFLLATASVVVLCMSTIAYGLFYYNFVPQLSLERVVHLQFGNGPPHGTAALGSELASLQPYDVSVSLHLPRTPSNLAAGNFMLELSLYPRASANPASNANANYLLHNTSASTALLTHSRRTAILTYASPMVDTANRVAQMPWYLLGVKMEAETLEVPMMELVEFAKGWRNLPGGLKLSLEKSGDGNTDGVADLQVYSAKVLFRARFGGLRYIMYNYRVLSFLAFTSTFWSVSMTSAIIAWLLVSAYLSPPSSPELKREEPEPNGQSNGHANGTVKTEEEESPIDVFSTESLSDSQRTFPSFGRQMPLRFPLREREIKREAESPEGERGGEMEVLAGQTGVGEADDEDEDGGDGDGGRTRRSDSGLGTSMEEGAEERRRGVQRRRSGLFGGGDGAGD